MKRDRIADRPVEPLELGDRSRREHSPEVNRGGQGSGTLPPAPGLLGPQRGEEIGPRRLGPVGARLDHSAGGHRPDADVGAHHEQLVIPRRRRELGVGILAGLDATGDEQGRRARDG